LKVGIVLRQEQHSSEDRLACLVEHRYFVPGCFVVFVTTRLALVLLLPVTTDISDAGWYMHRAFSIASGHGYSEGGYPTAYWPVGYPGFLAALFFIFGNEPLIGQVANIVLGAGSLFLVLALARRLFGEEKVAHIAVALLTIYPNHAAYAPFLFNETYFTFLLLLGTYLFIVRDGPWWTLLCGVVFGAATLTKPQVFLVPAFLVLLRLLAPGAGWPRRGTLMAAIILYAGMAAILTPWAIRNTLTFGEVVLISTNGGATLLTGNNPSASGDYVENDALVMKADFSVRDQVAADQRARQLAMQWIKENPGRFLALVPQKIWRLWAPDGEGEWWYQRGYASYDRYWYLFRALRAVNQIYYAALMLAFLGSLAFVPMLRVTSDWPYSLFPYVLVAYLTAISILFSGQSRFHFPAMPWIMMTVSWFIVRYPMLFHRSTVREARSGG
jgi:4-amino-4-deoxy-L-arabinose transferase-like glycosyltransferase